MCTLYVKVYQTNCEKKFTTAQHNTKVADAVNKNVLQNLSLFSPYFYLSACACYRKG